jgi:hypothetical protein
MARIMKDFVIRLQSRVLPISLRFLGVGESASFRLRLAIFEQLDSYANH